MSGVHDVGGVPGYGTPKRDSPAGHNGSAFAARWEAAVFAMMRCLGGAGVMRNSDQFRHAVERVDPSAYFAHGYYGRWLGGLETLLVEAGELDPAQLDARVGALAAELGADASRIAQLLEPEQIASRPVPAAQVQPIARSRNPVSSVRYVAEPPRFAVDQWVTTRRPTSVHPTGHTRLPDYALGCVGRVSAWHGGWVYPDSNAHSGAERPCHLYTVAFAATQLYGPEAEADVLVHLDLFEPYLEFSSSRETPFG